MFLALSALLFFRVCSADKPIIINNMTDRALEKIDHTLTEDGAGIIVIHEDKYGMEGAVLIGLNSLMRTGDCYLMVHANSSEFVFDFRLGYRLLEVANEKVKYGQDVMSSSVNFTNNTFRLTYKVILKPACSVVLRTYAFESLGVAILSSSLAKYDGIDISDYASKEILPWVNDYLDNMKPIVETILQKDICRSSYPTRIQNGLNHFLHFHKLL